VFIYTYLSYLAIYYAIGGDSKVLMIVQVAPVERHVNETLCSLNFAQSVRSVELGAADRKLKSAEVLALKGRLAQYEVSIQWLFNKHYFRVSGVLERCSL